MASIRPTPSYIPTHEPQDTNASDKELGRLQHNADVLYTYEISDITINPEGKLIKSNLGFFEKIGQTIKDWMYGVDRKKEIKIAIYNIFQGIAEKQILHVRATDSTEPHSTASFDIKKVKELAVKILFNADFSDAEIEASIDYLQLKDVILDDNTETVQKNRGETFIVNNEGKLEVASLGNKIKGFFTGYNAKVKKFIIDVINSTPTTAPSSALKNVTAGSVQKEKYKIKDLPFELRMSDEEPPPFPELTPRSLWEGPALPDTPKKLPPSPFDEMPETGSTQKKEP